jgi:hypothetical protein
VESTTHHGSARTAASRPHQRQRMCPGQLLRTTSLGKLAWWGEAGPGHKGLVFFIGAGVPEKDLVLAQQLRRQAARRAAATEEMLQAAAEGVKTRRREAAAREAAAAKAQDARRWPRPNLWRRGQRQRGRRRIGRRRRGRRRRASKRS